MAPKPAHEVAKEDYSEHVAISPPPTPDIGDDDDHRGIEQQQGSHDAVSGDLAASSGSSSSVAVFIELPVVNQFDA